LRELGPIDPKKKGRRFKKELSVCQFNVDIWCAQQTLRKRWKQRDWDVHEVPFTLAPRVLQRVIPEMHTAVPAGLDHSLRSYVNLHSTIIDREEITTVLYPDDECLASRIYVPIRRVDRSLMTLDKFL
jgi:hypothetical protein